MTVIERLHFLHRRLRYANRSEPETIYFIREFVESGDLVLDVGANKGIVTWFLAKAAGLDGEVLAFEPQPELILALDKIKATYGLAQIEILNIGLAEAPGTLPLFREYAGKTATMVETDSADMESILVEIQTLDRVLEERASDRRVSFVKCDVDGFERQVFEGATRMLAVDKPVLLVEIGEADVAEMCGFFGDLGYHDSYFYFRSRLYPTVMSEDLPYRKSAARYRNFLFLHDDDPRRVEIAEVCEKAARR